MRRIEAAAEQPYAHCCISIPLIEKDFTDLLAIMGAILSAGQEYSSTGLNISPATWLFRDDGLYKNDSSRESIDSPLRGCARFDGRAFAC
jgi:hypothetical protein